MMSLPTAFIALTFLQGITALERWEIGIGALDHKTLLTPVQIYIKVHLYLKGQYEMKE